MVNLFRNPSQTGRNFFCVAIVGLGLLTIFYGDFPYMLIPPKHDWIPGLKIFVSIFGILLVLAGLCIAFEKRSLETSLLLGSILFGIFCFYYIPYELLISSNYMHFKDWENAAKELALCAGAFVLVGPYSPQSISPLFRFPGKAVPFGAILFSIAIISFGLNHFLYAKNVANYVPAWVPFRLFWTYLAGLGLVCSGMATILKIKSALANTLLGMMIFTWFIILHVPRIVTSPLPYLGGEIASALLALAYSGTAFVIACTVSKRKAE